MHRETPFDLLNQPLDKDTTLIEASAGTGKTYNIQHLYLRLILEENLTPGEILVVTFTELATAELRERIRSNLSAAEKYLSGDNPAEDENISEIIKIACQKTGSPDEVKKSLMLALASFDEAAIFTIHGFCARMLSENSFESGAAYELEIMTDERELLQRTVMDFWRQNFYDCSESEAITARTCLSFTELLEFAGTLNGKPDSEIQPSQSTDKPDMANLWEQITSSYNSDIRKSVSSRSVKMLAALDILEKGGKLSPSPFNAIKSLYGSKTLIKKEPDFYSTIEDFTTAQKQYIQNIKLSLADYLRRKGAYALLKSREQTRSYDDMLTGLRNALQDEKGKVSSNSPLAKRIRKRFQAALVDEFQDTDNVQYEIFSTIFGNRLAPFFMIGDPKQSIYRFRGADIFAYLHASSDAEKKTLSRNFRSTYELLEGINEIFTPQPEDNSDWRPFIFDNIQYSPVTAGRKTDRKLIIDDEPHCPLRVLWNNGDKAEATPENTRLACSSTVSQITTLLNMSENGKAFFRDTEENKRKLSPGDIAVLVQSNMQADMVQSNLQQRGIPAVLYKSGNIFKTREAGDLLLVMQAALFPAQDIRTSTALTSSFFNLHPLEISGIKENNGTIYDKYCDLFNVCGSIWRENGIMRMFSHLMAYNSPDGNNPAATLAKTSNGERSITNSRQLLELLHEKEVSSGLQPEELTDWLVDQTKRIDEKEEFEMRLESDANAVSVMTVHKSKGLQFPVVFCPFLWTARPGKHRETVTAYHTTKANGNIEVLDIQGSETAKSKALLEEQAEISRLAYVALTRAQELCYIYDGNIKDREKSVLCTLLGTEGERLKYMNNVTVINGWNTNNDLYSHSDESTDCRADVLVNEIPRDWGVMSYSRLASHHENLQTICGDDEPEEESTNFLPPEENDRIFLSSFPPGRDTGNCVHTILEQIKFLNEDKWNEEDNTLMAESIEKAGFPQNTNKYLPEFKEMACNLAQTPLKLNNDTVYLKDVNENKRFNEMEFYLPVNGAIDDKALASLLRTHIKTASGSNLRDIGIHFSENGPRQGFMYGLIDIVFYSNGKYYFADWKTNDLSGKGGYTSEAITESMNSSSYFLQYLIYSAALHCHLAVRLPDYNYEKHFGGGFYIYVRGFDPDITGKGVFSGRLTENEMTALCSALNLPLKGGKPS